MTEAVHTFPDTALTRPATRGWRVVFMPFILLLHLLSWFTIPVVIYAQSLLDARQADPRKVPQAALLFVVAAVIFAASYGQYALEAPIPARSAARRSVIAPLLTIFGAVLIAVSFAFFSAERSTTLWIALWAGGSLLAILGAGWLVSNLPSHVVGPTGEGLGVRAFRTSLAALGALATLASFQFFGHNQVTAPGLALWLGGLLLLGLAFGAVQPALRSVARRFASIMRSGWRLSPYALMLVLIVMLAAVLRFWQLDRLPRELGPDLPINYKVAANILKGILPVFSDDYPGREALFFYLIAFLGKLFGLSALTTHIAGSLVGLASVIAVYFAGKELFNREVGLWAALLFALCKWTLLINRVGLRLGEMPLFIAAFLWALSRALKTRWPAYYYLLGLILGLGMYTYNAWYMVIPLTGLLLVGQPLIWRQRPTWRDWGLAAAVFVVAFLVFVPEFRYAHDYPQSFAFRVATRITSQEAALPQNVLAVFLDNLKRSLLMFNYTGDEVSFINVPFQRQFGLVSGGLLVLGVAYALRRFWRGFNTSLLLAGLVMLLPTALSIAFPNEVPNAGRASGAITPAILLAALPLALVRQRSWALVQRSPGLFNRSVWLGRLRLRPALFLPILVLGLLLGAIALELRDTWDIYFRQYAYSLDNHSWSTSYELAQAAQRFLPTGNVYIVFQPYWYDGNAVAVNLGYIPPELPRNLFQLNVDKPFGPGSPELTNAKGKFLFIVKADDRKTQNLLESTFQKLVKVTRTDYDGQPQFYEYYGQK